MRRRDFLGLGVGMTFINFIASAAVDAPHGLLWFEAENALPAGAVTGDPVTKRAEWQAYVTPTDSVEFESPDYAEFDPADGLVMTCNGITATVTDPTASRNVATANSGRFNTTPSGSQFLELGGNTSLGTITFDSPIAAFACYITDLGDFAGQVSVVLNKTGGGTANHDLDHTVSGSDGSLFFFGFVDDTDTYDSIEFVSTNAAEGIGIDSAAWCVASDLV